MTNKQAVGVIKFEIACVNRQDTPQCTRDCKKCDLCLPTEDVLQAYELAIQALSQELCDDVVSREAVKEIINDIRDCISVEGYCAILERLKKLPPVNPKPCDDAISREELLKAIDTWDKFGYTETGCFVRITKEIDNYVPYVHLEDVITAIQNLPPVTQKSGKCKNCKYFEYDSVAKVDGVPLIVAHEICNKWGDGCKTKEDGYRFLFEPQESEEV